MLPKRKGTAPTKEEEKDEKRQRAEAALCGQATKRFGRLDGRQTLTL